MSNLAISAFMLLPLLTMGTGERVRLTGGSSPREGRLEVYHNGTWGTVCRDYRFTDAAARVVCYMLGYGYIGQAIGDPYGRGSGQIWLEVVRCNGTEKSIADCRHRGWGNHSCWHHEDVSVSCITVRLVDGSGPMEGRLEVYHNGTWGTVCRNNFTAAAARVVCYMRGYEDVGQYIGNRYGAGSGTIWLDGVQCSGTETNIADCEHRGWGRHSCGHDEDVFVSCFSEVRLAGDSNSKGRLEVYHNGTWGTVCGGYFTDAAAARVVCYSLGYGRTGRFIGNSYGAGSGRIWLDNVRCRGSESHITECPHNGWGRHNCSHVDDVSVSCIADSVEAVALIGGGNPRVGRLEVFHGSQWGTVCDDGFTDAAARVVCYSLGFGYVGRKEDVSRSGTGDGLIWLNNINCTGTEQHIGECSHGDWGVNSCTHHEDVAVSCTDNTPAANANDSTTSVTPVRLIGGSRSKGRLEVFHDGVWGTVCDDSFTALEAHVICKMLGLGSGVKISNNNYRTYHGPIWLDNVRCSGRERDIVECSHNGWGVHDCGHHEDVSVSCFRVEVRLNGGRDPREGRLEVFYDGVWAKVCDRLNYATALVVCNVLGFEYVGRPPSETTTNYQYGRDHQIWLSLLRCTGTEESIDQCNKSRRSYCSHREQSVSCLSDDAVALFGGGSPREGRLEVYHNGIWGTVCNTGFTDATARVVCYSLGFGYVGRRMNISTYGIGKGVIWLEDIHCDGTERHIGECSHSGWRVHDCTHNEDVAVSCIGDASAPKMSTSKGTTHVIVAVCTVGGLLMIICVVVIVTRKFFSIEVHCHRKPPRERTEAAVIPTQVIASTNRQNESYELAVHYENLIANNSGACSGFQTPSSRPAGAVGTEDIYCEPSARYETLSHDAHYVEQAYDTLTRN